MIAYKKRTERGNTSELKRTSNNFPLDPENAAASSEGSDEPVHLHSLSSELFLLPQAKSNIELSAYCRLSWKLTHDS